MSNRPAHPILGPLLKKLAPIIGARVLLEPRWNIVGQITFKNGKRGYFRYGSLDVNPLGAAEIARDKDYANFFMKRMGYPVVRGEAFFSDEWAAAIGSKRTTGLALRFAQKIGFPVFVKPNSGSQGAGVALVHTRRELAHALCSIFQEDRAALVQRRVRGRDYRIVVLDDNVISSYERVPLGVVGDGRSTIRSLLMKKQREFAASRRDTALTFGDPRMRTKLKREMLSFESVPKRGERVALLDNANLSTGGEAREIRRLHPEWKKLAIRLTKDMGLRLCGIDLIADGALEKKPRKFRILEVNAAPGLDHYARGGRAQERTVEKMYLKVLKSLEKN